MQSHALRIQLLVGFPVTVGQRELTELMRWKRPAALLQLLALAPGHALHREQAQDVLWTELDAQAAANNLHGALHQLRHLLEPRLVRGSHSSYLELQSNVLRLHSPGSLWIDVEAFDLAATMARRSDGVAAYESALALYAGDLLPYSMYVDPID